MTDKHPITPPPELMQRLRKEAPHGIRDAGVTRELCLIDSAYRAGADQQLKLDAEQIAQAYQAGADQELDACCNYFEDHLRDGIAKDLRAARRPKPPSLKEQALGAMGRFTNNAHMTADEMNRDFDTIRRALEQLND